MTIPTHWDHMFFILIGIVIPIFSIYRGKVDPSAMDMQIKDKPKFYYANAAVLWIGVILVFLLWVIADRSFSEMGFQNPHIDIVVAGLTGLFVFTYVLETTIEIRKEGSAEELMESAPFLPTTGKEFLHFSFLAFSAGFCEEVVYRGFLVNYLMWLCDDPVIGITVAIWLPAIIFGMVHMYQGWTSVLKISIMSLLFGAIFIFSQSLLIVVILHFLVDLVGGFLAWRLSKNS